MPSGKHLIGAVFAGLLSFAIQAASDKEYIESIKLHSGNIMELRVNSKGYPILDQFSEEGFIDCVLKIVDLTETDNAYSFHLSASYDGNDLGLNVEVVKGIKSGFDSEMSLIQDHVYKKGVRFYRSGTESDLLISTLATLYGMGATSQRMPTEETFTGIALHQGEIDMRTVPVKIKIFGNDQNDDLEENYYESFFNLDLANGFVFWNEKDQEYREPLIRGLSE